MLECLDLAKTCELALLIMLKMLDHVPQLYNLLVYEQTFVKQLLL